jgi:hypothetical protein
MKRLVSLVAVVCALAALAAVPAVAADGPVKQFSQPVTLGFYRGQVISYFDFGPVKLAKGNTTAPIWVVTNGVEEQRNVIDVVPGQRGYTPLWAVRTVAWKSGVTPRVLRSRAAVAAAAKKGEVTIASMPIVVNCPVL